MINIVENFLNVKYQDFLENLIVEQNLPLYYNPNTIYLGKNHLLENEESKLAYLIDSNTKDTSQFTHNFIQNENIISDHWIQFLPITYFFMAKCGIGANMILKRAKLNFQLKDNSLTENQYNVPHIDQFEKGITGIYYVNDCDGSTVFFDKSDKPKIIQEIQAKKGTFIYFDSNIYHAGKPAKQSEYKSVINFNWKL
jgi:hypothetical protein